MDIKIGNKITFNTHCGADRKIYKGVVKYNDALGFFAECDNVKYVLRRLINVSVIK